MRAPLIVASLAGTLLLASGTGAVARAQAAPLLGSHVFYAPQARGFGSAHPAAISNGGDPSGIVTKIRWSDWGGATAIGHGSSSIYKPNGGYYPRLVGIELRAQHLGTCSGKLVYRQLEIRVPKKPGGPLGSWILWSGAKSLCAATP
jgi:hypothetical protein